MAFDLGTDIYDYLVAHSNPPDAVLADLAAETAAATGDFSGMQISSDEGALLTILARLTGARFAVELGTFTGYSSICIARGLAPGGRLLCCDVSEEWTAIVRRAWERAGVDARIELRIAPAIETLQALPEDTVVDFAFVDADKVNYIAYYEALITRLRPGGLIAADNVLWSGRVVEPDADDENTVAIRAFNDHVAADERVDTAMLPVRDGVLLCLKR